MLRIKTLLAGAAGLAALAAAAPSSAQYYGYRSYSNPYAYNNYGYSNYGYGVNTSMAAQQCSAAVRRPAPYAYSISSPDPPPNARNPQGFIPAFA